MSQRTTKQTFYVRKHYVFDVITQKKKKKETANAPEHLMKCSLLCGSRGLEMGESSDTLIIHFKKSSLTRTCKDKHVGVNAL
jgi:hypothetical protein